MNIVDDNKCTFGKQKYEETLTHLFWVCEHIQTFVQQVINVLNINNIKMPTLICQDTILGISIGKMNPIKILLVEIKRYILCVKKKFRMFQDLREVKLYHG
jgi:hypothetical protein